MTPIDAGNVYSVRKNATMIEFFQQKKISVSEVSAGDYHCAALTADGAVYVWMEEEKQLPPTVSWRVDEEPYSAVLGSTFRSGVDKEPQLVAFPAEVKIAKVACGGM